jgi:hypothetical protein
MLSMSLPQAKTPDTNVIFIISYEKRWSCRPALSVLLMNGRKLGSPKSQETTKRRGDQLSIIVDGKVFTSETKVNLYSNGMELVMFAPSGLVDALGAPRSVIERFGSQLGGFDFSDGRVSPLQTRPLLPTVADRRLRLC